MFDTVNLILHQEKVSDDFLESVPCYLDNFGTHEFSEKVSVTGYLGNLKIGVNKNTVKINGGSLSKYYFQDSFKTMKRKDVQRAIEKLSDDLHLPFKSANVTRIDIAQNLFMDHPEKIYYPYLGNAQYYSRSESSNGLYYMNKKRTKVFYGKIREQKNKKQTIPLELIGTNILRYELRFLKRIREQFKQEINGGTLYDESFFHLLLQRYEKEYLKINKKRNPLQNMKATGSTKIFRDYLAILGLDKLGNSNGYKVIKEWQERKDIGRKQASDLRLLLKRLTNMPILTKESDLISELDRKVKEAVLECLNG